MPFAPRLIALMGAAVCVSLLPATNADIFHLEFVCQGESGALVQGLSKPVPGMPLPSA